MTVTTRPKISLSLDASDTTIMHRAGMTGLYMTLKRLGEKYPSPRQRGGYMSWVRSAEKIELFWEGSDLIALSWLIKESFQIDDEGLIHLTGLDNKATDLRQKIHIHEGMCAVFLRHNQFYKAGEQVKIKLTLEEKEVEYQYKSITWYAHQTFAEKLCETDTEEIKQNYIQITSWLYLGGIVRHARTPNLTKLEEKPEYALALLFVPVVCHYCLLHLPSEDLKERKPHRYVVVIPEIKDLQDAAQRRWRLQELEIRQLHVSSIGEAGLLYYSLDNIKPENDYYQNCQAWLYERLNKTSYQRTLMNVQKIEIDKDILISYKQVKKFFCSNNQRIQTQGIYIKVNPIRSLIADNLAKRNPWWSDFWERLIEDDSKGYLFKQLLNNREGIRSMIENSEFKEKYLAFVNTFQHAMTVYFAKIYAKTEEGKEPPISKKIERLRSELNCCYDELSFQQYLSDFLARGGLNEAFYRNKEQVLVLIEEVPWEKLRIWSLLAIASYKPKERSTDINNNSTLINQEVEEVNNES